jgi:hypothetical protein
MPGLEKKEKNILANAWFRKKEKNILAILLYCR